MQSRIFLNFLRTYKPIQTCLSATVTRPRLFSSKAMATLCKEYQPITPVTLQLDSKEIKSIYTDELKVLADLFKKNGYEIRVAGGAVRDLLMGITPHDLDFATTATPDQMKEMFERENIRMINAKGEKHGTITPRINDKENFEVTTLRIDVTTDGRHAEVQFTTNWQLDANRRDLTINCLFMDLEGVVYDYFNGIEDIKVRKVAFVGDADTRIKEDFLRILRYFRFYGRISKTANNHDPATLEAIRRNVSGLANISGERIWTEFKKILEGKFSGDIVLAMIETGVAPFIGLPAQPDIARFQQVWSHLKDVEYHGVTLMSGLLDSIEEVWELQGRLKMSAYERDLLLFIVEHRDEEHISVDPLRPYQLLVMTSKSKITDAKQWAVELLKSQGYLQLADDLSVWEIPRFPINGNMVKEKGCPGGKMIGMILLELKCHWVKSGFEMKPEELLELVPSLVDEMKSKQPPASSKSKQKQTS